jgi:hypothetical protein
MQARACWVYERYGAFEFKQTEHLKAAIDKILQHLHSPHIAVKVEAAKALSSLLAHDAAVGFMRPGLGEILKIYLKIMDEIDFEDLVKALKNIVEIYGDEINPFALSLCMKLSEAYVRLAQITTTIEDEDAETGLTADGLMGAIRRVLNSISGKFPALYPQLETVLETALHTTLSPEGMSSVDEGLTCIAELIYNQNAVSGTMWRFYERIVSLYVED